MSKRNHLPYIVECKPPGQAFYEPICAFNCAPPAVRYATDCFTAAASITGYNYRVRDASKRRAAITLIYSSEHPVSRLTYRDVTKKGRLRINVFLDDQLVGAIKSTVSKTEGTISVAMYFYVPKGRSDREGGRLFATVAAVKRDLEAE